MTNAQKNKIVRKYIKKWKRELLLNEWMIHTEFRDENDPGGHSDCSVLAETHVDTTYLQATISFFPSFFTRDPKVQERATVHELCHVLTQESWDIMGKLRHGLNITDDDQRCAIERLTQRISYIAFYKDK